MKKENITGDAISGEASICKEQVIRTTGRNNCGGRCVICVHMKAGKIDHLSTEHPCDAPEKEIPLTFIRFRWETLLISIRWIR